MNKLFYVFVLGILLACNKEAVDLPVLENELGAYITSNDQFPLVRDSLIACAFGGQFGFLENSSRPISILFYPEGNATAFRYFETDSIEVDPDDLSNYQI